MPTASPIAGRGCSGPGRRNHPSARDTLTEFHKIPTEPPMPKSPHLADESLIELLGSDDVTAEGAETHARARAHLAACRSCTTRFEQLKEFSALLAEADVWHLQELK